MKKLIITSLAALALFSCSEHIELCDNPQNQAFQQTSNIRSVDEAIRIAGMAISSDEVGSRSGSRKINPKASHVILGDISRSSAPDTLLYALDLEDNGGFVLVAAPHNVEPIMAIIDQGSFDDPENIKNEPYQQNIGLIKSYIANKKITDIFPTDPDTTKLPLVPMYYYDTIDIKRIHEPAIEVAWGQEWPENIYAPNQKTGCIPLAIAQLFTYLKPDAYMNYTFEERDIAGENIDWNALKKHKRSMSSLSFFGGHCVDCSVNDNSHFVIGRVIRQLGVDVGAVYGYNPTSYGQEAVTTANSSLIEPTVKKYTLKNPVKSGSTLSNLYSAIDANGGAAIMGSSNADNVIGHCWIADGSQYINYQLIRYDIDHMDSNHKYIYTPTVEKSVICKYIHYNWGDGGVCNGWFNIDAIEAGNAVEYDYDDVSNVSYDTYHTDYRLLFWLYNK